MAHKDELDYMNAVGCLLVVLIHVFSIGIVSLAPASWAATVIYFPWRLSAFAVPMFLYVGAVKVALQHRDKEITAGLYAGYCFSRLKKIYFPFVIWNMIYYACFTLIGYVSGNAGEFFWYLSNGTLSAPFYYIITVMQFYLLMPIWLKLIQHISVHLAIIFGVLVTFCAQKFPYVLSFAGIEFPYMDRVLFTYILYWIIGLYIGASYEKAVPLLRKKCDVVLCALIIAFCCGLFYTQYVTGITLFDMDNVKIISDVCSIVMLHYLANIIVENKKFTLFKKVLQRIYNGSFFVYLSHCLFLVLSEVVCAKIGIQNINALLIVRFLTCYTLPFLTFFIWVKARNSLKETLRKNWV